jgi:N-acetylmuramoyl-L-alanine amidase
MNTSTTQTSSQRVAGESRKGTFYQLQVVISVAFLVATLFTAWTPADLLPGDLTEKLSMALAPAVETQSAGFPTSTPRPHPRIGLVAGHWGNDPGAVCSDGLTEVEINLNIATKVKENLVGLEYDVDLLKEFDPQLSGYQALALISIHADSCDYINELATGFKVASAMSSPHLEKANRLTNCLIDRYQVATGLSFHKHSVTPDMTSYHAFEEIHTDTIAAIIEVGFMNLDRQILTQQPDLIAEGISDGILCFIQNEDVAPTEVP